MSDIILSPASATTMGRLARVEPRSVWPHEAINFTPWLLANADVLSDLLGMDLVLEVAEHPVGGFSLDLKGHDETTNEVVIVENQLEMSDHTHLGQIITYAAGTEPSTIVWITTGFRDEHRAAIDWLNQRTDEATRFFGVVIRVVRIGTSDPAPNFELVAQPNDWNKQVKRGTSQPSSEASERATTYRAFWDVVIPLIIDRHPTWTRRTTSQQPFLDTLFGVPGVVGSLEWTKQGLRSQIYLQARDPELSTARFAYLFSHRDAFEAALGEPATWDPMDGRKASRVYLSSTFTSIEDRERWTEMAEWLVDTQTRLRAAWHAVGGATDITTEAEIV